MVRNINWARLMSFTFQTSTRKLKFILSRLTGNHIAWFSFFSKLHLYVHVSFRTVFVTLPLCPSRFVSDGVSSSHAVFESLFILPVEL